MILNTQEEKFIHNGITYKVGGKIYANEHSDYAGLVGTIIEIRNGSDKETENDGSDIYCYFEPPVFPADRQIFEERFSALYGIPKTINDISFGIVIMAPEQLLPLEIFEQQCSRIPIYVVTEDWAYEGDNHIISYYFSASEDAKVKMLFLLSKEMHDGLLAEWSGNQRLMSEIEDDFYSCWINDDYLENHYQLTLSKSEILYSPLIRKALLPDGYVPIT